MKHLSRFLVGLIASMLLLGSAFGQSLEHKRFTRHIDPAKEGFYSWINHGMLFYSAYLEKKGYYLYYGSDRCLMPVTDIPTFSRMMREELDDGPTTIYFIKERLPTVLTNFLAHPLTRVIDQEHLHLRGDISDPYWGDASKTEREQSLKILKKYEYVPPKIDSGKWRTHFHVETRDGSIERWDLDGDFLPFSVNRFTKSIVEKPGTVVPMPLLPGGIVN